MKNLIKVVLVFSAVCLAICSCSPNPEPPVSEPEPSGVESSVQTGPDAEEIERLIANDEQLINIFYNGTLANKEVLQPAAVGSESGFADYSAISSLIRETYTESSGMSEFFAALPGVGYPAIDDREGRTYAFYHPGSSFTDFIDVSTASVTQTEPGRCSIEAATLSGIKVSIGCAFEVSKGWRLENSVCRSLPETSDHYDHSFPDSRIGSLKAFKGELLAVELYISDKSGGFEEEARSILSERIGAALDYFASLSKSFGNTVNVTRKTVQFMHKDLLGNSIYDLDLVLAETSLGGIPGLLEAEYDLGAYDNYLVFVCIDKDFATASQKYTTENGTALYYAERVTVNGNSSPENIIAGIYDLLGLYSFDGADCGEYLDRLFRIYFPNDIAVSGSVVNGSVSPLTAYICGFTDELAGLYRPFCDWYESPEDYSESAESEGSGAEEQ